MDARDREVLIEEALTAWRPRSPDGLIHPHPAWADLAPGDRQALFDATLQAREIECLVDPDGLSTTARAVLRRLEQR